MKSTIHNKLSFYLTGFLPLLYSGCLTATRLFSAEEEIKEITQTGQMLKKEGDVNYWRTGQPELPAAQPQPLDFGDGLHTLEIGRATVRLLDLQYLRLKDHTRLEIRRSVPPAVLPTLKMHEGQLYVSERGRSPRVIPIEGPHSQIVPKGTEFLVAVDLQADKTEVTMFDGEAQVQGTADPQPVRIRSGEQGITTNGQQTVVRPILQAQNIVQWWIYYPGLLDPDEIGFDASEQTQLTASLQAYRQGDLPEALKKYPGYPTPNQPSSDAQRVYLAGLYLAVGAVDRSEAQLSEANSTGPATRALRTMIRAVTVDFRKLFATNAPAPRVTPYSPATASEWLAVSYAHQATNNLKSALEAARNAVARSPNFGFGWARIGELEFSFGHTRAAREAAERAIRLSPRNAQAHALNGFLLAAEEHTIEALAAFDQAIDIDSSLGNAWLGRGLCKIRESTGWFDAGFINSTRRVPRSALEDLQTAAILEPTRSLVHSYAGKAFAEIGDDRLAHKELDYAAKLDPNDPTVWLYMALLEQQENRVNQAISDLEASQERNDNRSLFRSRLLLDEDRAVRSANLAAIYRDAGMFDVSVREASRAVTADYGNYSAHLFLANSYNELRDAALVTLRYETATFSEYLLANLLSPVGGSALSPYVSQQEYSRLFEQNRLGFSSQTDYSSRGDWQQQASQFGWFKNSAYAVDVFYRSSNGQRPNNDIEQQAYSAQFKQQLTPYDSLYLQAVFNNYESGDVRQVYDPSDTNQFSRTLRVNEKQEPNLFLGYHHEWSPGIHTLFLAGRLDDRFHLSTSNLVIRGVQRDSNGAVTNTIQAICQAFKDAGAFPPDFNVATCDLFDSLKYQSDFEAYSAELQQIAQLSSHTFIVGGRYQDGETETQTREVRQAGAFPPYPGSSGFGTAFSPAQNVTADLTRLSFYGYDQWQALDQLWLTAGLSYDHLRYPRNSDSPPISTQERTTDQVSPKAGFAWTPFSGTTLRGAYTKSLGGLFYDTSVRLEPVQIAGFNQAYRSLIPESIAGAVPGSRFETLDFGVEQRLKSGTYMVLGLERLRSEANRDIGVFNYPTGVPSQIGEKLEFEEHSLIASINQLLGRDWALGARYKVSHAELKTEFPDVPAALFPSSKNRALLHNLDLFAIYNHPSGFFAEGQALWAAQDNYGSTPGDNFWQINLFAGYRFPRRQAQITLGLLNVTAQDYRLNPLNLYTELPRNRTLVASLKFNF